MGTLARLVKDAELVKDAGLAAPRSNSEGFLAQLEKLRQRAAEPTTAPGDIARMEAPIERGGFGLPTAYAEGRARGIGALSKIGLGTVALGVILRLLRARAERAQHRELIEEFVPYAGAPTRDIHVPLSITEKASEEKQASSLAIPALAGTALALPALAHAVGMRGGEALRRGYGATRRGVGHLFSSTGSPWDEPWVYPAAVAGSIGATYLGYKALDAVLNALKEKRMQRELTGAKREFEEALTAQHRQSGLSEQAGTKYSAAGATGFMADVLAKAHISGELSEQLEKLAQDFESAGQPGPLWYNARGPLLQHTRGLGNKAFGIYLAALAALTLASAAGGYRLTKGYETKRKQYEAAKDVLRRRRLTSPPQMVVEPAA